MSLIIDLQEKLVKQHNERYRSVNFGVGGSFDRFRFIIDHFFAGGTDQGDDHVQVRNESEKCGNLPSDTIRSRSPDDTTT